MKGRVFVICPFCFEEHSVSIEAEDVEDSGTYIQAKLTTVQCVCGATWAVDIEEGGDDE